LAAINANAFAGLPGTENDIRGWYKNRPVDIQGMVVADGKVISPAQKGRTAFWTDKSGHPKIGDPEPGDQVWQAVGDWSGHLMANNRILADSTGTTLHPRSAVGFDDAGKWLILMVVDGRQPGFSEGVSLFELARLFQSKGCTQAINLDGGGSSIMLISNGEGTIKTVNSPSGMAHRPIPVMLGIRKTN
jgi:exopolysaccharide biosynthesis protein